MCTAVKKSMQEILAATNTTQLVVEIRPKDVTSSKTCVTHLHQNHQTCSTPSSLRYKFQPKNRLNLNGNIIILLAINNRTDLSFSEMAPNYSNHFGQIIRLPQFKTVKLFPTRPQFPYECLNCPYVLIVHTVSVSILSSFVFLDFSLEWLTLTYQSY